LTDDEIEKMKQEARENEAADKEAREKVDKMNAADSLIFQSEKQLKEFGDKLPADKKEPIEKALEKLKEAHKSQDLDAVDKASAELNTLWQAASEDLYKASQAQGADPTAQAAGDDKAKTKGKDDEEVTDVDFEEVK
jgi:molecular chaperone DnaK